VPRSNPIDQTRLALAAVTACLVDAIGENEPAFRARFEETLNMPTTIYERWKELMSGRWKSCIGPESF